MIKVLIISYHFPPQDIIAAYRGKAFFDHLPAFGYRPTIITHHWEDPEKKDPEYENWNGGNVVRLPFPGKGERLHEKPSLTRKLQVLRCLSQGFLEPELRPNHRIFNDFLEHHLKEKHYDLIVGIFSPHFVLKLCYGYYRKLGMPYVLDFRDLWANRVVKRDYRPSLRMAFWDWLTTRFWKKWLKESRFISITSRPWLDKIRGLVPEKPGVVVMNGYEEELFEEEIQPKSEFQILHAGSLYKHQHLTLFLEAMRLFFKERPDAVVHLRFIGAKRKRYSHKDPKRGFFHDIEELLGRYLSKERFKVTYRIPKKEAVREMKASHLLLAPTFPDTPGTYGSKIFDYLRAERPILAFPDDDGSIRDMVNEIGAGRVLSSVNAIKSYIEELYRTFENRGDLTPALNRQALQQYSRRAQVEVFAKALDRYFEGKGG